MSFQLVQLPRRSPVWRREAAAERLRSSQRQRAWLWSRDNYPSGLLAHQGVWPLQASVTTPVLARAYWCYQAAAEFLFFEEILITRTSRAGATVHRGALNGAEDLAEEAWDAGFSSSEEQVDLFHNLDWGAHFRRQR